ncbi:hypothetical protein RvY_17821-2 [Ramazzottius varieornatus]|uniref:RNA helicase n=1 Tax=Ramazzottius varieornatus TaxID=947166 RepID=A0A1D1W980_RAMVA|nr:hypothetical protein RvY_17821-2 [Ramazzottius varieornatus]
MSASRPRFDEAATRMLGQTLWAAAGATKPEPRPPSAPAPDHSPQQFLQAVKEVANNSEMSPAPLASPAIREGDTRPFSSANSPGKETDGRPREAEALAKLLQQAKLQAVDASRLQINEQTNRLIHPKTTWAELKVPGPIERGLIMSGFDTPTLIQSVALDFLFKGKNLIAQSQSGTGKTISFVIGILKQINADLNHPQALVLEPTYELAQQTAMVIRNIVNDSVDVTVIEAVRGSRPAPGSKPREHIIVGTPGTVLDWATKFKYFDPKLIKIFILDEADVMIAEESHQDQSVRIYKMMDQGNTQTALFSATYNPKVMEFAKKIIKEPELITVKTEELSLENIHQYFVTVNNDDDKLKSLRALYGAITVDNAIVFCRSKEMAHRIYDTLKVDGHPMGILAGDMDIQDRSEAIARFRKGQDRLLITTNVSARGIDVLSINMVVNFDLPMRTNWLPDYETYIHRIGRTGRFGRGGLAINFVKDKKDYETIKAFQNHFKREIKPLDTSDIDRLEQLNILTSQ